MKHHDRWTIKRSTRSMLWGSALAMLISCALFAGATHAWFSDRCSAQIKLQSATFNVDVEVALVSDVGTLTGTPETSTENGIYVYNLSGGTYKVTLKRGGSASVGYCKITVGGNDYYSPNLPAQTESFSFTLTIAGDNVPVTFTPVWRDVTKVEGVDPIDSGKTISYSAGSGLFAMGAEPVETVPSEPEGTPEPETEEKNNSEEVPSGADGGSSDPKAGENAGDAKDSSEVKQPEVIPETSSAEASKDSSENQ